MGDNYQVLVSLTTVLQGLNHCMHAWSHERHLGICIYIYTNNCISTCLYMCMYMYMYM